MQSKVQPSKPFILLLYGFPGSGKTSFAKQLSSEMNNLAHVHADRLIHELFGKHTPQTAVAGKKAAAYMCSEFLKAGVSVIYDADVHRLSERRAIRDMARKAKATPLLVWLQIDAESAFQRTQRRDRRKAEDKFAKEYNQADYEAILQKMQNPENEDYVVLSGKHTFHTQKAAVMKKMFELGVVEPNQVNRGVVKPELVNLVQQSIGGRADISRRNISIR